MFYDRDGQLPPTINLPEEELKILELWKSIDAFHTSLKQSVGKPRFTFYDGPPFATGLPHYGHLLAGSIKDIITRYAHQRGHYVERRFGWDCHGLPVEYEVDKENGITGPSDVEKIGIKAYNEKCRAIVMRYSAQWQETTTRLGRWIDFDNDYRTMYPWFMESVWWVFKQLYEKGLVYRGVKVMPFSTACSTPISNFEAGQNYKDVQDPAIVVSFPLDSDLQTELVAWTTTPWTLVSNLAVCVHPSKEYVKVSDISRNRTFVLMKARLSVLYKKENEYKILEVFEGKKLANETYQPIFDYFSHLKSNGAFRVLCDNYVTEDVGTGLVQQAPYFGEDDFRVCMENKLIHPDSNLVCPVGPDGRFTEEITHFAGLYVKDADKLICQNLKQRNRLVYHGTVTHSYPFCWRSDTPLIYKAVPTWFIRVEQLVDRLLVNNSQCYWVPDFVREGRFANWLRDARDWAISRNRFWGTPIPLWISEDSKEAVCIGSIDELQQLSGVRLTDLHKEFVDQVTIPSKTGRGVLKRINEVFDCWFESGSMPYAQLHFPFENNKAFAEGFPADFIAEGIDQTRGWFYTLLVISTALFDKPPFRNLIVNGIVLASDGQKMSKRAKNYPDPNKVIQSYGADALRLYLINSPVARAQNLRFKESGVMEVVKDVFLHWYSALRFLIESSIVPFKRATNRAFILKPDSVPNTNNFMDRWILSFTQSLIVFVHQELTEYRLYTVVPRLVKFIDHLVNWYVRMNRRRLKGDCVEDENDWFNALHTLFKVIYQITRLMSPFTPFMCEYIYQRLRMYIDFTDYLKDPVGLCKGFCPKTGAPDSIHYLPSPTPHTNLISCEIEEIVANMQATVELGRIIRSLCNIPLKAPLREAVVIHADTNVLEKVRNAKNYIIEELNVRNLTVTSDKQSYGVQLRAVLNHSTLGVRLKKSYKSVVNAMKSVSTAELETFLSTGRLTVCGHELSGDDLTVVYTTDSMTKDASTNTSSNTKYKSAACPTGLLVLLDTTPDAELEGERLARELVNRIQRTRKKANLLPEDPIVVVVLATSSDYDRVAGHAGVHVPLIQSVIKQPLAVFIRSSDSSAPPPNEEELHRSAKSVLTSGWSMGAEIIHESVSIPPDEIELIIYRRCEVEPAHTPSQTNGDVVMINQYSDSPYVNIIHSTTNRTYKILLRDGESNPLVNDTNDLLRKVRCMLDWSTSANLLLYTFDTGKMIPLSFLNSKLLCTLNGQTLYAAL